jgi:hypothetical protein
MGFVTDLFNAVDSGSGTSAATMQSRVDKINADKLSAINKKVAGQGTLSANNLSTGFTSVLGMQKSVVNGDAASTGFISETGGAFLSAERQQEIRDYADARVNAIRTRIARPGRSLFLNRL